MNPNKLKPEKVREIINWHLGGKNNAWIAKHVGVAEGTVQRYLQILYDRSNVGDLVRVKNEPEIPYRKDLDEYSGHWMGAEREDNR